jgi:hypothetical protein
VTQNIIRELENFLIQTAVAINPDLLNVQGTKATQWSIHGVVRSAKGAPSQSAIRLTNMFHLKRVNTPAAQTTKRTNYPIELVEPDDLAQNDGQAGIRFSEDSARVTVRRPCFAARGLEVTD